VTAVHHATKYPHRVNLQAIGAEEKQADKISLFPGKIYRGNLPLFTVRFSIHCASTLR
jgi:hypothetical protein